MLVPEVQLAWKLAERSVYLRHTEQDDVSIVASEKRKALLSPVSNRPNTLRDGRTLAEACTSAPLATFSLSVALVRADRTRLTAVCSRYVWSRRR